LGCHAFALICTASVARMWHPVAHRKALSEQPQQSQGVGVTLNELLLPELFLPDQLSPSPSFHPVPVRPCLLSVGSPATPLSPLPVRASASTSTALLTLVVGRSEAGPSVSVGGSHPWRMAAIADLNRCLLTLLHVLGDLLEERVRLYVHEAAVLGSPVVTNPCHPSLLVHQDEGVARLPRGHLPLHDPIRISDLVPCVRQQRSTDPETRRLIRPRIQRIRRQAQQLDPHRLELRAVLQVNYLLHARRSTGAHAEVQEHRLVPPELVEREARRRGANCWRAGATGLALRWSAAAGRNERHGRRPKNDQGESPPHLDLSRSRRRR